LTDVCYRLPAFSYRPDRSNCDAITYITSSQIDFEVLSTKASHIHQNNNDEGKTKFNQQRILAVCNPQKAEAEAAEEKILFCCGYWQKSWGVCKRERSARKCKCRVHSVYTRYILASQCR
jgi:hypothetical protein